MQNVINLLYSTLVLTVLIYIGKFAVYTIVPGYFWIFWLSALFWMVQVTFENSEEVCWNIMDKLITKL